MYMFQISWVVRADLFFTLKYLFYKLFMTCCPFLFDFDRTCANLFCCLVFYKRLILIVLNWFLGISHMLLLVDQSLLLLDIALMPLMWLSGIPLLRLLHLELPLCAMKVFFSCQNLCFSRWLYVISMFLQFLQFQAPFHISSLVARQCVTVTLLPGPSSRLEIISPCINQIWLWLFPLCYSFSCRI